MEGDFLGLPLVDFSVVTFSPAVACSLELELKLELLVLPAEPGELVVPVDVSDSRLAFDLPNAAVMLRNDNSMSGRSERCRVE